MENILGNLEISRPKNRVIEKLLVMGLIRDKKEVNKKKTKRGRKRKWLLFTLFDVSFF